MFLVRMIRRNIADIRYLIARWREARGRDGGSHPYEAQKQWPGTCAVCGQGENSGIHAPMLADDLAKPLMWLRTGDDDPLTIETADQALARYRKARGL